MSIIKAKLNTMTPIATLPIELLTHVFRLYISSFRPTKTLSRSEGPSCFSSVALCTLTFVCRHWRAVVHATPTLWAVLDVRSEKRMAKMLEMSGKTPLTLHASTPRFRVLDSVWHRRINLVVEKHSRRLVELHLSAPITYIKNALEVAGGGAPLLRSLKISGRSNGPVINSLLPAAMQDWVAPQLDEIILTWFGISWTSPLLMSCAHRLIHLDISLRAQFDPETSTIIPSQQQLADRLGQMTCLRTLSLRNCLPPVVPTEAPPAHSITLPSLTKLHLVGSVAQCHSVWTMLHIPQRYQLSLGCTTEDPSNDIPQLFPSMETFLRGTKGSTRPQSEIVRGLSIDGSYGLHCQFWTQPIPVSWRDDPSSTMSNPVPESQPLLYLSFTTNESEGGIEAMPILGSFLTSHILPHLHSLELAGLPGLQSNDDEPNTPHINWTGLFGAATELTSLVLQDLCPQRITALLSDFTTSETEGGSPLWSTLNDLYLNFVQFYYTGPPPSASWDPPPPSREDGEVTFQALKRCLLHRKEAGVGPNFLSISDSHSMTREWYTELKEAVPTVFWDKDDDSVKTFDVCTG